ncbi:MAG: L,D-transpeptidase [Nocardioidaceae bacterium]
MESLVATAAVPEVEAFREPNAKRPFATFDHPSSFGTPRVFLVQEDAGDWVRVLLPMRPNGIEGWVWAEDITLASNPYRIEVDLGEFELTAYKYDRVVLESRAAIGTGGTPTPQGLFFTTILAKPSDPASPYGKYAYGLSAYSEVLNTFAGGDGQVAIHGTNQPSLIGSAVSHGCVRVDNPAITKLARFIPLGTPVRIHP